MAVDWPVQCRGCSTAWYNRCDRAQYRLQWTSLCCHDSTPSTAHNAAYGSHYHL